MNFVFNLAGKTRLELRPMLLCFAVVFAFVDPASSQTQLPAGKGKETVENICSQCHTLRYVTESKMTRGEWEDTVHQMVDNGAPLVADEIPVVIEYLARNFPKAISGDASGRVNINKAAAKELEAALSLSAKEAEAVVSYREKNGTFTQWEDLQKVPDLDAEKLEAVKDRLDF